MNESEALKRMIAPGTRRPGKYREGVIQIWVTRACDRACFNCTQGSNLAGNPGLITLEQFDRACECLQNYFGVVGMFGGNPAMHPQFDELCAILRNRIPYERRGLWCNNPLGKGKVMRETFNPSISNLNVHLDRKAYDEFKRDWPECHPVGLQTDSRHSPVHLAMMDVIPDESQRWELISGCDINRHWSAMFGVFRGELRFWFCEIAGAQAMLHQHDPAWPDTGFVATPDCWRQQMEAYAEQVRWHCHRCGVPLRGYGELACAGDNGIEQTSLVHLDVYRPKRRGRIVQTVSSTDQLGEKHVGRVTDYIGNAGR